ncbi:MULTISPECIES: DUF6274 family protein [unclassified Streptomyces]|uniref:DUF6274 family protein n=1 Tax=unclassified Streptomyces TaxID=2593676 RepID=UPI000749A9DB|nr:MULTISPECIES: DUF6274 family protein [unclassified Streptomyces]KUL70133.1 hypothetical protein ADL33_29400 [Streptomyces sp. NRRL WC-3604]KUL71850.1 hypothetical protein ADL34_24095 [Streptomyces sp. NRRL WC-3605]
MAASTRHETRALLRAHLSAASSYRHLTRHCPICHRLLRLALDNGSGAPGTYDTPGTVRPATDEPAPEETPSPA